MKKTILLLVLVMAAMWPVRSQDTLHMMDMRQKENYLVCKWPDSIPYSDYYKCYWAYSGNFGGMSQDDATQDAWRMYTEDTLQVYGIALGVFALWQMDPDILAYILEHGGDTSLIANSYHFYRLYEAEPDSLRHIGGEELEVNLRNTPVSYYLDLGLYTYMHTEFPIIPMRECYFSSPIEVADSFYVGRRFGPKQPSFHELQTFSLGVPYNTDGEHLAAYLDYLWTSPYFPDTIPVKGWVYYHHNSSCHFVFPILTPPDSTYNPGDGLADTTGVSDTTDVGVNTVVYRHTSVSPNPATGRVKVLSSFGLQHIEAYDAAGVRVYEGKAEGLSATLDVSSWPKGMYVLRIATAFGPTTKKLLVQ